MSHDWMVIGIIVGSVALLVGAFIVAILVDQAEQARWEAFKIAHH